MNNICKQCNVERRRVTEYSDGKLYQFYRCPMCYSETRKEIVEFDSFNSKEDKQKPVMRNKKRPKRDHGQR